VQNAPKSILTLRNKHLYTIIACLAFHAFCFAQTPTANFKSDITGGCSPIVVNFQDISTGNPTSWFWDFGNGGTSTKQNPSTTYFSPGTYAITLTATNAAGSNTITQQAYIQVFDPPVVDFIYDKNSGCTPYKIQFTDQSTQAPNTINNAWFWDFGDGQTSNLKNPQHIYRTSDNFTVTLKVTSDKGCAKTITKANIINIIPGVVPAFDNSLPATCAAPATINFTNNSGGPGTVNYFWNFGDGVTSTATSPTHTYAKVGNYDVSLVVTSNLGCSDTLVKSGAVSIGGYKTDFTVPAFCEENRAQITNTSSPTPVSSLWLFPDGTTSTDINPKKRFPSGGNFSVKLINNYGNCVDSVTKTVTATAKPAIAFTGIDSVKCAPPLTVNFNNTTGAVSYTWDFGDSATSTQANPGHTYTKFGNYSVTVIATNAQGCIDTLVKKDYIKIQKPVLKFKNLPQQGCIPYTANFEADITSVEPVVGYSWDFGDGTTSSLEKPSHVYSVRGTYDVTLTITTKSGCTEKISLAKAVKVGPAAVAAFTVDQTDVCAGIALNFTDLSTPTIEINEWKWEFGDGGISTDQNPKYVFQDTGFLDVKLTVFNNGCPSAPLLKQNYVHTLPPVSKFDYQPDCNIRTNYTFTDKSIDAATWLWDFGDGSPTFAGKNPPLHSFPSGGSYTVSLTTTKAACSYTLKRVVAITDNTPDFTVDNAAGCKPFQTHLIPASPNPGLIKDYTWDFGNGLGVTNPDGYPVYTNAGLYNVTLTTTDTFGCKDSRTKNGFIRVNGPIAAAGSLNNQGCKGLNVNFLDQTTTDGTNSIVKWQWDFGDGTPTQIYTQPLFTHVYDTLGNFDIKFFVQDAAGCTDNIFLSEFVKISTLKANWSASPQTCPNALLYFENNTKSQFPINNFWDFGDGTTSTDYSLNHAFADTGFYTIKLKVKDQIGCEDSLERINYIQVGLPKADFDANNFVSFCTPFEAKFTNTSTFYNNRSWDLDIAVSGQENPSIYYTNTGTYDITLSIVSPGGCTDAITKQLRVFSPQDATLTYSPLFGCSPVTVSFEAFAEMRASFVWDYGDGNVIDTTVNKIEHTYKDFGSFVPKIIMTEPSGTCKIPLTGTQTILVVGAKTKFGINKNLFCDSGYLRISDSTTTNDPALSYVWDYGDGAVSTNPYDTLHFYSSPGNYSLSLKVTTANGCVDTLRSALKVVQSPVISMISDSAICVNERMRHAGVFNMVDSSQVNWLWRFPNGNTAFVQNPASQQYTTPGNFTVNAYAVNSSGCIDSAIQKLVVNPLPTVTLPSTLTMQNGFPITIPATYSSNVINYSWLPDNNTLSCVDCPEPATTNTKFTTKYSVSFVDSNGCKNTADVQVIVICMNANVFVPNTFSPNGDGSNDVFYIRGKGLERVKSLRVFNRWGEVVFEKKDFPVNDPSSGWNGKFKSNRPQADVYIYQVEVFCENGDIIRFDGNLALIQ
jgi:gliding motility-associated-like protein